MKLQKPTKTIKVAMWRKADGSWFQTTVTKQGKWFVWETENGPAATTGFGIIRTHAKDRSGHIETRPNANYDIEMREYRRKFIENKLNEQLGKLFR